MRLLSLVLGFFQYFISSCSNQFLGSIASDCFWLHASFSAVQFGVESCHHQNVRYDAFKPQLVLGHYVCYVLISQGCVWRVSLNGTSSSLRSDTL